MIILAHDGSLYGDWVARYAVSFAAAEGDRKVLALHVLEGKVHRDVVEARFAQLDRACQGLGVEFVPQTLPLGNSVHRSLRQAVPHEPGALLVCGTRVKPGTRAFLGGSVAAKLLRMHQCPVLALRVVQPGLLGNPHELLLPLAGHDAGFARVWPVFQRLAGRLRTVHLLRVLPVHPLRRPHLTPTRKQVLRRIGAAHLSRVVADLAERLPNASLQVERRVVVSTDWPNEVLMQASRLKVQMILLGVSERSLAHRVLHGVGLEEVLRKTSCDVGVYRGP
ncbi:MAG: universal stress protein [Deferrisomatales bacterium]|nr:universal stress protein [Deferrisomatales bacterium]